MKAIMFVPHPAGGKVEIQERPVPDPKEGEALVKVFAAGLNRGEIGIRQRLISGEAQATGIEFAGQVVKLGTGLAKVKIGDRVMGHWRGGQAEYVTVDQRLLVPIPPRLSWIQAGACLNVFLTAHDAIMNNAKLRRGEAILITGASSSIGIASLHIARFLGATPIIGSSRSARKLDLLKQYGLQNGVMGDSYSELVLAKTHGKGVDVVIDNVGANVLSENLKSLALDGRLVSVGRLGAAVGAVDLDLLALKRLRLIGVTFRTRTLEQRIACIDRFVADLWKPLADGQLDPVVYKTFPMEEVREAHKLMESNEHTGKIVIEVTKS